MAADTTTVPPPSRRRRRVVVAVVVPILLLGGIYLYVGPLSPHDSGNSFTTSVLLRPVCDGLITRAQARHFLDSDTDRWSQTDPGNLTEYTCYVGRNRLSVALFPDLRDSRGTLLARLANSSDTPEPLGGANPAGTTMPDLTWVALSCPTPNGPEQLLVNLDRGGTEQTVATLAHAAAAVADRRGCQRPDLPPYKPRPKPRWEPLPADELVCGLLDPAQLGVQPGWMVSRDPTETGPTTTCIVTTAPRETGKRQPPYFSVLTFSGPFLGPGTDQLDFSPYTGVAICRGPDRIYGVTRGLVPGVWTPFVKAMQTRHITRCEGYASGKPVPLELPAAG